jgi:hypothetical protein
MTTPTTGYPAPDQVAYRAKQILAGIHGDEEYTRLVDTCRQYNSDWTCQTGTVTIDRFDLATDAEPLIEEALRALALKAAMFELTDSESAAEIGIPLPVDEVLHAVLAQRGLLDRMTDRTGVRFVHMTDLENEAAPYREGGFTTVSYMYAWGTQPPERYWLDAAESDRRKAILKDRLDSIGLYDMGRRHGITFADVPEPLTR